MKIHAKTCYDELQARLNDIIFSLSGGFSLRGKLDGVKKNLHKYNFLIDMHMEPHQMILEGKDVCSDFLNASLQSYRYRKVIEILSVMTKPAC